MAPGPKTNPFIIVQEFLKNAKQIGSIWPDSRWCIQALLKRLPLETAEIIVEWGGGSGAVTRSILKRLSPKGRLICFELNPECLAQLETIKDPRLTLVHENFLQTREALTKLGIDRIDGLVSTLPASLIPCFVEVSASIAHKILKLESGRFVQYVYASASLIGFNLGKQLSHYYPFRKHQWVFRNLPPAIVHTVSFSKF